MQKGPNYLLHPYTTAYIPSYIALYCCTPASPPLLSRAGSPSLFIDASRLTSPYCCGLHTVLAFLPVFSLHCTHISNLVCSVVKLYLWVTHNIDSNAIVLIYINWDFLFHLWVQRGQPSWPKNAKYCKEGSGIVRSSYSFECPILK
jgi:hypothetical protein